MWLKGDGNFASVSLLKDVIFSSLSILKYNIIIYSITTPKKKIPRNIALGGETYRQRNIFIGESYCRQYNPLAKYPVGEISLGKISDIEFILYYII